MFITFGGPNGCGKTTILHSVAEMLRQSGHGVIETKEPTRSPLGDFIRGAESSYDGRTFATLIAADRYFHIDHEILPALQKKNIVLSDRYAESSLVLQRFDGVGMEFIWELNNKILVPDLSIILVASPDILDRRLQKRKSHSRFEENMSREKELQFYYDAVEFLKDKKFNFLVLENGTATVEENTHKIIQKIEMIQRRVK